MQTSDVDHADWNYRPLLGKLQRTRFQLIKALLPEGKVDAVLEIGYGSGVFFPELLQHGERISGIDPHPCQDEVAQKLAKANISADLKSGSASEMPFEDDSFDTAVAVSALEYVEAIDDACNEIKRVLRPGGSLVLVTPGKSPILDAGLQLLGGEDADSNYGDRREHLLQALHQHFYVDKSRQWPWPGLPGLTVYRAMRLRPR